MATQPVGTIVFDLDGVLYLDRHGIPGAGASLRRLEAEGWQLLYATNNSTKTREIVARHIAERTGFEADPGSAVTSAMSAAHYLEGRVGRAGVVGGEAIAVELERRGIDVVDVSAAEAIVVGLDLALSYEAIRDAARAIRHGALFVATNVDSTYPTPDGPAPGAGSVVAAIATAAEAEPVVCGKPESAFNELLAELVSTDTVVMVGDRPETDLALGVANGWLTVLVLTGVTPSAEALPGDIAPDLVLPSIRDLPDALSVHLTS